MAAPYEVLDIFLFHNVHNSYIPGKLANRYEITYEGDKYVVWDRDENKLYHFVVKIVEEDWDSAQARKDQEWEV